MRLIAAASLAPSQRMSLVCRHGFDDGGGDAHPGQIAEHRRRRCAGFRRRGRVAGVERHKPMDAQPRAFDAKAGLAAGIDEHAGAGAIRRPDVARSVGDADGGHQPARANDLAHDDGLIQIAARRGQHDDVAGREMGFVEPLPEPARGGGADRAADRQYGAGDGPSHRDRHWRSATTSCSAKNTGPSSRPRPRVATGPGRRGCRRHENKQQDKEGDRQKSRVRLRGGGTGLRRRPVGRLWRRRCPEGPARRARKRGSPRYD